MIGEALGATSVPLTELLLGRMSHTDDVTTVQLRLAALIDSACRPSLRLVDCRTQGLPDSSCVLFADDDGVGVVPSLCKLISTEGNSLTSVRLGGNGAWPEGSGVALATALGAASCVVEELDVGGSGLSVADSVALASACGAAPAWARAAA